MSEFVKVASTDEVGLGSCKTFDVSGSRIALFNVAGNFYAMDDTCAHRGGPLGEGTLDGAIVTCPLHGWQYDVSLRQVVALVRLIRVSKWFATKCGSRTNW